MSVLVQIRDVPEDAHRRLKAKAALEGRTLAEYLRQQLVELAALPSDEELWQHVHARSVIDVDAAAAVREDRARRR